MINRDLDKIEKWHFEVTEQGANSLLKLVLDGKKRATASSLRKYEIEKTPVPKEGDLSIITYWDGTLGCLIKTTKVTIIPFNEVTFDLAKLEGEDETLKSWQDNHIKFFTADVKESGYEFSDDIPVVFEEFEVLEIF